MPAVDVLDGEGLGGEKVRQRRLARSRARRDCAPPRRLAEDRRQGGTCLRRAGRQQRAALRPARPAVDQRVGRLVGGRDQEVLAAWARSRRQIERQLARQAHSALRRSMTIAASRRGRWLWTLRRYRAGSRDSGPSAKRTRTAIAAATGTATSRPTKPKKATGGEAGRTSARPDAARPIRRRAGAKGYCPR